ncbi:MAG: fibronectin type III domain-containing protein [Oscillospiraceae bacterium]|nr:fibronectin type III domain-containing protein [Oscillospiraceae bacterium]
MKKALSALLAAVMVLGLAAVMPITASAALGAPKNLVLTPGDGTITVMFDPPDDNGSPIFDYSISWSWPDDWDRRSGLALSVLPYTISGLTNGTEYTIQVDANYGAYGNGPTVTGTCTPHVHDFGTVWVNDATGHWHACSICGAKSDVAAHTPGGWAVVTAPTATTAGSKQKTCTVCGYVMETQTIAATGKFIKLWGKETKWLDNFGNWLLVIFCFGWIWMAF